MTHDAPFRVVMAVWFAAMLAIGGSHRWRAWRAGGTVPRRGEGVALMIGLRLVMLACWGGVIVWAIRPEALDGSRLALPPALRWAGAALALGSLPLIFWVFHALGLNVTDTVEVRAQHTLVRHGPYRWVRHPLYTAVLLAIAAFTMMTANALVGLSGLAGFLLLALRTRIEEAKLIERYGDRYLDYMRSTPRYLPGWGGRP